MPDNYQDKAAALDALSSIRVCIRKSCDWYVDQAVEVGGDGFLNGIYGNGGSPAEAIEDHWHKLVTNLPVDRYLVVKAGNIECRRHVRWNGFMWEDLPVRRV
jgi:hypothetical protein